MAFLNIFDIVERQSVKAQLYNFNDLTSDREWLYDILLSDTESEGPVSDEDVYISKMLREHLQEQRQRKNYYKKPTVRPIIIFI